MEWIQLQNLLQKPKLFSTLSKKCQSRVSKALAISIFMAKFPPKDFLFRTLIASEVTQMQSLMLLPLMKPRCCVEMIAGMILESLSARILEMSLNLKFAMAIGL